MRAPVKHILLSLSVSTVNVQNFRCVCLLLICFVLSFFLLLVKPRQVGCQMELGLNMFESIIATFMQILIRAIFQITILY